MKKRFRIALLVCISLVLIYLLGLYNRYNIISGIVDRLRGNITIVYYGEPGPYDTELGKVAMENDFRYIRIAGCVVNTPLINGAKHYNWIMKDYLKRNHSQEFLNKF